MTRRIQIGFLLFILLLAYAFSATQLRQSRTGFIADRFVEYTIPSQFLKPLSLEFKGLASDLLLVKFMTFIGARTEMLSDFSEEDWDSIRDTLKTITDLDPYYWDAYLFAQVFLTWDETHYADANDMLLKAKKYIPDNYRIPYYIGLNYYNFANDPANGAKYVMEASKLPGSPYYLASFAARLSAYGSEHQRGVIFLQEMLKQTADPDIAGQYKLRIEALQSMYYLEQTIRKFELEQKRLPSSLKELKTSGYIDEIPSDPYGGRFYMEKNGKVATTSKLVKRKRGEKPPANKPMAE